jgi:hypothetical protein
MQFELEISPFDLIEILAGLIGSRTTIEIQLTNGANLENCIVKSYDKNTQTLILRCYDEDKEVTVNLVERIEFQGFHRYKSQSSKIFIVK